MRTYTDLLGMLGHHEYRAKSVFSHCGQTRHAYRAGITYPHTVSSIYPKNKLFFVVYVAVDQCGKAFGDRVVNPLVMFQVTLQV